ncbi:hypothetical protein JYT31_01055 [Beggiatoa alba]|nr:hypothetical protein [Beggiatoa alba]
MKQNPGFSDEMLNAYIDGELSTDDELSILDAMRSDNTLLNYVNELKHAKLLLNTTYSPGKSKQGSFVDKKRIVLSLVATLILTMGVFSGWVSHDIFFKDNISFQTLTSKKNDAWNIVLHVNTNDKYLQNTILDETESLLESFKGLKKKVKVEIVAYGQGVFLFDRDQSKYKKRLLSLKQNFKNLSYAVCGRTVKRIEKMQGRKIQLIENILVARSGIYQIIKRQKQGWNYIRI